MNTWFLSDPHFGHDNVIEYCGRPWANEDEMDEAMIGLWNEDVRPGDLIYVGGDFMIDKKAPDKKARVAEVLARLNGRKILIFGNHDRRLMSKKKFVEAGFAEAHNELIIEIAGQPVRLHHYPYRRPEFVYPPGIADRRPINDGKWLIHGHVHNKWGRVRENMINISVDVWDFRPVALETIVEIMARGPQPHEPEEGLERSTGKEERYEDSQDG